MLSLRFTEAYAMPVTRKASTKLGTHMPGRASYRSVHKKYSPLLFGCVDRSTLQYVTKGIIMKSESHTINYALVELAVLEHPLYVGLRLAQPLIDARDASTQWFLGYIYHIGWRGEPDMAQAVDWYHKAAEQGYPRAQAALGGIQAGGVRLPKRRKSYDGWPDAPEDLGYDMPGCSQEDCVRALNMYREAKKTANGQLLLGIIHEHGIHARQNKAQALKLYQRAASAGLAEARLWHDKLSAEKDSERHYAIPCSPQEPKILGRNDAEVVCDRIAEFGPPCWDFVS